jgi:hypothetical protein
MGSCRDVTETVTLCGLYHVTYRVLGRIFEPKRDKVTGQWRKLYNEEIHDLYSSPAIVWVIKSRRMR